MIPQPPIHTHHLFRRRLGNQHASPARIGPDKSQVARPVESRVRHGEDFVPVQIPDVVFACGDETCVTRDDAERCLLGGVHALGVGVETGKGAAEERVRGEAGFVGGVCGCCCWWQVGEEEEVAQTDECHVPLGKISGLISSDTGHNRLLRLGCGPELLATLSFPKHPLTTAAQVAYKGT